MGLYSAPAAPAAPNPAATAAAQSAANRETAITQAQLNAMGQNTPFGSLSYSQEGTWGDGTPRLVATQTLSPSEQRQLDLGNQASETYGRAANAQLGQVEGQLSRPFDPTLPAFTGGVQNRSGQVVGNIGAGRLDFNAPSRSGQVTSNIDVASLGGGNGSRDAVQAALMGRMDPSLNQLRSMKETSLRNQGIMPGSEAWMNEMRDVSQAENDARMSAIINAGNEQSRIYDLARANAGFGNAAAQQQQDMDLASAGFRNQTSQQQLNMDLASAGFGNTAAQQQQNMDLAAAGFGNQARGQSLAEQLTLRSQPINEASALLTGQMIQQPNFVNTPTTQVAPTDYLGAVGLQQQSLNNAFNQKNANYQSNLAGLYGLGGSAISAAGMAASPGGFFRSAPIAVR